MWKYVPATALSPKPCSIVNGCACTNPPAEMLMRYSTVERRHGGMARQGILNVQRRARALSLMTTTSRWHVQLLTRALGKDGGWAAQAA